MSDEVDAAGSGLVGGIITSTNVGEAKKIAASAQVKSQWKIDSSGVATLRKEFQGLLGDLKQVRAELTAISKLNIGGMGGGGGSNSNGSAGPAHNNGGGFNINAAARVTGSAIGLTAGLAFHRVNRGAATNVVSDQVLSQYAAQYGGTRNGASNAMTGMQFGDRMSQLGTMSIANQYGMGGSNFGQYAKSINQMIAMTGNTNTMDAAQSYMGFANPASTWASKRFGGNLGAYGANGQTNDFGSIVSGWGTSGLIGSGRGKAPTVSMMAEALKPGSIARANLSASGINGSSQDDLLTALQINAQSGNGGTTNFVNFNTKNMKQRLANATGKAQGAASNRDENFMSNNYAALVDGANAQKKSQELLGSIDHTLTGMYSILGPMAPLAGGVVSLGKSIFELAVAMKYLGIGSAAGGGGIPGGALGLGALAKGGLPIAAGAAAGYVGSKFVGGNSMGSDVGRGAIQGAGIGAGVGLVTTGPLAPIGVPLGILGGTVIGGGLGAIKHALGDAVEDRAQSKSDPGGFTPEFRRRLNSMMQANPRITVTGGSYRSHQDQINLFLSRYVENPNGNKSWNGKRWSLKKGMAPAATPGMSLHESGQAADLGPSSEWAWIAANAEKYGLDIKSGLSIKEPWHVQLVGAVTGGARGSDPAGTSGIGTSSTSDSADGSPGFSMSGPADFTSSMSSLVASGLQNFVGGGVGHDGGSIADYSGGGGSAGSGGPSGGSGIQGVVSAAKAAGFTGQGLVDIVAIAMRESKGNPGAHNTNAKTGDNSYGYTQINMLGKLGPARLKQFGLTSADQLLDPLTNMKAAFQLSKGGTNFNPWGGYKGMDPLRGTNVSAAQQAIGDASQFSGGGMSGGVGMVMHNHFSLHVMNSTPQEAARVAQMIGANLEQAHSLVTIGGR